MFSSCTDKTETSGESSGRSDVPALSTSPILTTIESLNVDDPSSVDYGWTKVNIPHHAHFPPETMQERIVRVAEDEKDLNRFYTVPFSVTRAEVMRSFYQSELDGLDAVPFDNYSQEDKVDYVLLKKYLKRELRRLELKQVNDAGVFDLLPFAHGLVKLCEARQAVKTTELKPKAVAQALTDTTGQAFAVRAQIEEGTVKTDKMSAYRAVRAVRELQAHLADFYKFFKGYDPLFDWWVVEPYNALVRTLEALVPVIEAKLVGVRPGDKDAIIGDAIGRDGLLAELEAEVIPYTPEELLVIANRQYAWCESEMKKASRELGFGDDWKAGLEHVKNLYNEPGEQVSFIKQLVDQAAEYVKSRDLVTVPPLADSTWKMNMMSPEAQKVNPFFLGGHDIIVSFPTAEMSHPDKLMSMRGNNKPMSLATAFHEMIPGHRLQVFMITRHRPYRRLFSTPFSIEGWAMYWEFVLWNAGDFFPTPEDRIGTLFWRMHRCARIIFSLKFHLGQLTPQECVDLLVDMVGHERATAEGEVRRSLNGNYSPLYQAGYMLGALQLLGLRAEVLRDGVFGEKEFHDRVLRANQMPIELLRALLLGKELTTDYKAKWKFQG